ncbi:MAG: hypothetical protein K2F83_06590, partial [Oscillospiraceae bacterium]|nr:hypothetical protein [Oscillospiraceae bacterium]
MKKLAKILAMVLCISMVVGLLGACGNKDSEPTPTPDQPVSTQPAGNDEQPTTSEAIKIGVLVADVSGEEDLGLRS